MNRRLLVEILVWAAGSALAGAATGVAVGIVGGGGLDGRLVSVSALFGEVVGIMVLASNHLLGPRLRGGSPLGRGVLLALFLLSGAAGATALLLYFFPLFLLRDLRQAFGVVAVNSVLALVLGVVVHVYETMRWRLAESLRIVEEVRLAEARLREQAARAELAALQARIHPHFLFNTLHTISSLVSDDPERAEELVQALAELFRYSSEAAEAGRLVPLGRELEFVRRYLDIERARLGERLRVVWDVDPRARPVPVPGLLLQPLVENAVGHGIARKAAGGTVRLSAKLEGGSVRVEVEDDGAGAEPGGPSFLARGHALDNVRRRLETVYRGAAGLELEPLREPGGFRARLLLPLAPAGMDGLAPIPTDGGRG
jgi:signal transduction histidine kinase